MGTFFCCQKKSKGIKMKPDEVNLKKNIFAFQIKGKKKDDTQADQDVYDEIYPELGKTVKFMAVYDGHGSKGREAATLARDEVRKSLINDKKTISTKIKDRKEVEKYFKKVYQSVQSKFDKKGDFELSGTCAVGVLLIDQRCYFINLGDSRAVMGAKSISSTPGQFQKFAYQMTIDHKAGREDEKKRVESKDGVVLNERNGIIGPQRVYPKNDDGPGLCVARSFGDVLLHSFGVIEEPEISYKEIENDDKFVVIGSDGLFDVMNSAEVVGFIFDKYDQFSKEKLVEELAKECRSRWESINSYKMKIHNEKKENQRILNKEMSIDDITAVVMFLNDI